MEFDNYGNEKNYENLPKVDGKKKKEEEKKKKEKEKEETSSKDGNNEKQLEIKIKMELNKEKDEIYKVYELSDNRLAVELENSIKIYSLKTFHLLTEINHDNVNNSMELKNKDIAITCYRIVYFYKLSGNNYINHLQLEEKNKKRIYEIYELKNDNLILCFRSDLEIYKKEKEEYKFLTKFELNETVGKIQEIKTNQLFLFLLSRSGTYATADYSPYYLQILNIDTKEDLLLNEGCFSRYDNDSIYYGCNLLLKNNKYLFARYAGSFCIFNIEDDNIKNYKCIYRIKNIKLLEYFPSGNVSFCDYDYDDGFIILSSKGIYKYDEIANKIILKQKFTIDIENIIDIIKLKNNNFIIYNKNEIFLINNY